MLTVAKSDEISNDWIIKIFPFSLVGHIGLPGRIRPWPWKGLALDYAGPAGLFTATPETCPGPQHLSSLCRHGQAARWNQPPHCQGHVYHPGPWKQVPHRGGSEFGGHAKISTTQMYDKRFVQHRESASFAVWYWFWLFYGTIWPAMKFRPSQRPPEQRSRLKLILPLWFVTYNWYMNDKDLPFPIKNTRGKWWLTHDLYPRYGILMCLFSLAWVLPGNWEIDTFQNKCLRC